MGRIRQSNRSILDATGALTHVMEGDGNRSLPGAKAFRERNR